MVDNPLRLALVLYLWNSLEAVAESSLQKGWGFCLSHAFAVRLSYSDNQNC